MASRGSILKYMLNQLAEPDLDRVFQALADPGRRVMVDRLSLGPASVSELAKPLAMSLAAVVQHVQVLEASGLVRTQKTGRTRTCRINASALRSAETWIADRRSLWERRLDRLGDYLADTADGPDVMHHEPQGDTP
jgi:DNA-binding transcriptional ArsR family regulator